MRIKQFVIMIMIICGCVSAGCKNKEVQESDKTASDSSRLARQEVEYPEKEDTYEDWEQVGEFKINSRSVEQDVHDTDTSYLYIMGFSWPVLYDKESVKFIEYTAYNARVQFEKREVQLKEFLDKKVIKTQSKKISGAEQEELDLILYMEFPTSTYSWYMNKQSSDTVLRERNDMLNAILIEAKVIYNDGKEETCYYRIQTGTADSYMLFKRNLNLYNYSSNFPHFTGFSACPLVK